MRIDYNILWFEDVKSSFDAKKQIVKEIVEDFGFSFPEPRNEIDGTNIETIDYDNYDLLIVDLNLAGTKGPALIDKIRHNEGVYTEVVFYSSDGEKAVRNALKDFEIDGAYCAGRDNDDFEEKVKKVIKTTIKKVQDINNMRGLIMAETSDLDEKMVEIIQIIIETHPPEVHKPLIDKIFADVGSSVNEKKEKYDKWNNNKNIAKLLSDTLMLDASKKLSAVQHIIEVLEGELFVPHKENKFSEAYKTEIGETRNIFAHVTVIVEGGVKKLKSKKKEIVFTDEYCSEVRAALKKYSVILEEIKNRLITP